MRCPRRAAIWQNSAKGKPKKTKNNRKVSRKPLQIILNYPLSKTKKRRRGDTSI